MATSIGQYTPVFLPGESPSLTEKPGRPESKGPQRVGHEEATLHTQAREFVLPVAALPQWELSMKVVQLLGLWGPWRHNMCRDTLCCRSYGPIRVFFWVSCSWRSEGLFGRSFSIAPPFRHLEGSLVWGPYLLFGASGTERVPLPGVLLCRLAHQALTGVSWVGSSSVV